MTAQEERLPASRRPTHYLGSKPKSLTLGCDLLPRPRPCAAAGRALYAQCGYGVEIITHSQEHLFP